MKMQLPENNACMRSNYRNCRSCQAEAAASAPFQLALKKVILLSKSNSLCKKTRVKLALPLLHSISTGAAAGVDTAQ
jgi:hypothetical protein